MGYGGNIKKKLLVEDKLLSSTNSYFTNKNVSKEQQLKELPNLIII